MPNSAFSQVDDTTFQSIEGVTVTSEKEKKIAFEDAKYYIVDFTISEARTLLLMKNFGNYFVYHLDEEMRPVHKLDLGLNADKFFEDCFGNTHLVTRDSVYLIEKDSIGLFLTDTHPRREFMSAMKKCAGSTSEKVIFESRTQFNQFQKFHTVDVESGDRKVIYEINDTTQAKSLADASEQLLSEVRMTSSRVAESKDERTIESIRASREAYARRVRLGFFKSHVILPEYNPMFVVEDTLYFFNHAEGKIDQMDDDGNLIHSKEISYHQTSGWENKVYSDRGKKQFYAVWTENGVQHLLGLALTEDQQEFSSEITKHAYPKKVMIVNGYAYYTYKPNFDSNLNKLYKQKL